MIKYIGSWFYSNLKFDLSTGELKKRDLFSLLQKIDKFDYNSAVIKDEFYFLLKYTQNSVLKLLSNINNKLIRSHQKLHITKAKEFDNKTLIWLSKQQGISIRDKLKNNQI